MTLPDQPLLQPDEAWFMAGAARTLIRKEGKVPTKKLWQELCRLALRPPKFTPGQWRLAQGSLEAKGLLLATEDGLVITVDGKRWVEQFLTNLRTWAHLGKKGEV